MPVKIMASELAARCQAFYCKIHVLFTMQLWHVHFKYRKNSKYWDISVWANSVDSDQTALSSLFRIYAVCHFFYIFRRHYFNVKLNCFILRTTTVAGLGVPIFRVITVSTDGKFAPRDDVHVKRYHDFHLQYRRVRHMIRNVTGKSLGLPEMFLVSVMGGGLEEEATVWSSRSKIKQDSWMLRRKQRRTGVVHGERYWNWPEH